MIENTNQNGIHLFLIFLSSVIDAKNIVVYLCEIYKIFVRTTIQTIQHSGNFFRMRWYFGGISFRYHQSSLANARSTEPEVQRQLGLLAKDTRD